MMSKSSVALLRLLSFFPLLAAAQQTTQANCTVFNWDNNPAYIATYPPQRVSAGGTCPENEGNLNCPLAASGDAQYAATVNITRLSTRHFVPIVADAVTDANSTQTDDGCLLAPGFNSSVIGSIDQTRLIEPGQSAYLNFTAFRYCYEGMVGNCTEGVEDGTAVQICAPVWHNVTNDGFPIFDGKYTVVNISANEVDEYSDPYENQVRDDGGNAAAGLKAGSGVALGGLVTMMMMLV
ncbi:hypothetical protein BJY01DRAFT_173600 [Aspergillus pseudoustus]|uniref:Uncharacterized protein n=1 Tax=Aspergillus pseudoustus TaxID=1810923 RepID=A0ABR4K2S9_9EURO